MSTEFGELADEFIGRVRAAKMEPSTEVILVYHCLDEDGNELAPIRFVIPFRVRVKIPELDQAVARRIAESFYVNGIIETIDSLVRGATNKSPGFPIAMARAVERAMNGREHRSFVLEGSSQPVFLERFSLEINQTCDG